jgi:hypothetical protein
VEPKKIVIDKKYNNASSIAVFDQICPDNKIKRECPLLLCSYEFYLNEPRLSWFFVVGLLFRSL